jgi:hypothetical protein
MTTVTININDKVKLVFDGYSYMPFIFRKGGEEYFDPKTREKKISQDKWVDCEVYFSTVKEAIRYIARQQTLEKVEYTTLKDYLDVFENNVKELLACVKA